MTRGEVTRALDLIDRLSAEYSPERLVAKMCRMQHKILNDLWNETGDFVEPNSDAALEEQDAKVKAVLALWPKEATNAE